MAAPLAFWRLCAFSSSSCLLTFSSIMGQFSLTCPSLPQKRHFLCGQLTFHGRGGGGGMGGGVAAAEKVVGGKGGR